MGRLLASPFRKDQSRDYINDRVPKLTLEPRMSLSNGTQPNICELKKNISTSYSSVIK